MMMPVVHRAGFLCSGFLCALLLFSLLLNLLKPPSPRGAFESSAPITITTVSQTSVSRTPTAQTATTHSQPSAPLVPSPPSVPTLTLPAVPADMAAPPGTDSLLASLPGLSALTPMASPQLIPDTDIVPIFSVPPEYPRQARKKGIEGWVQIRFTITETGTVKNMEVVEASPAGYFEQAAMSALKYYRFRPREISGRKVARVAEQRMVFQP